MEKYYVDFFEEYVKMWLRFTDVEIGTKTIQMRKDLEKGQSYETVVENTGYSGGNGIAAECGNRDSESEIIFWEQSVLSFTHLWYSCWIPCCF